MSGFADWSYGCEVALLAGVSESVVSRGRVVTDAMEAGERVEAMDREGVMEEVSALARHKENKRNPKEILVCVLKRLRHSQRLVDVFLEQNLAEVNVAAVLDNLRACI